MNELTVSDLVERFGNKLDLRWISGRRHADKRALSVASFRARPSLVGYLNLIHPNRIQVLGREELTWLDQLGAKKRWETIAEICAERPAALIVAGGGDIGDDLEELARDNETPLLRSARPGWELVSTLQYQVARALAHRVVVHGVFMEIFTLGVLITGDAGAGKSELALELLTRGHRLIADDSPEFTQMTPDIIDGTCPEVLRDCLEVRGLGVLNVRRMFGDAAVKPNKFLRLILHLHHPQRGEESSVDRLAGHSETSRVLDLDIPRILLPVLPGRNLAVIAEAAVRNFMLRMKGFDATADFLQRHGRFMRHE
ncbi:MAG: HPr(Ser) kinase/phosphatase [Wenzhouxiangellaceae bacterium]|nr:HPr(Ser) kinase/phosphatase [Wenzhouxiangellaceae bacterium]MBS3824517.1 HPr(Ser) kinase/phosphatase [Wenzhouxiangellaceae bacterium]